MHLTSNIERGDQGPRPSEEIGGRLATSSEEVEVHRGEEVLDPFPSGGGLAVKNECQMDGGVPAHLLAKAMLVTSSF